MRWPLLAWPSGLLALSLLLLSPPASAQDAPPERGAVRLRAGVASHQSLLVGGGKTEPYAGRTANDWGLSAHLFSDGPLGGAVELEREVMLMRPTGDAGQAHVHRLVRGQLALAARGHYGPLQLLARVGYGFAQLPFGLPEAGDAPLGWQHAVVLAPRARVELPWWALQVEAFGELWLPVQTADSQRQLLDSQSATGGLAVGRRMGNVGPFAWSLWLDAQTTRTAAARGVGDSAYFRATRVGLSTELTWDAVPSSTP